MDEPVSRAWKARRRRYGQLEADVLGVLWSAGRPVTPRAVHAELANTAYTTVLTALSRLHKKGLVARLPEGRSYAYLPTEGTADAAAGRIRDLLDHTDSAAVLTRFVDRLDPGEEDLLRKLLSRAGES